jgi:hypothetical protein
VVIIGSSAFDWQICDEQPPVIQSSSIWQALKVDVPQNGSLI